MRVGFGAFRFGLGVLVKSNGAPAMARSTVSMSSDVVTGSVTDVEGDAVGKMTEDVGAVTSAIPHLGRWALAARILGSYPLLVASVCLYVP